MKYLAALFLSIILLNNVQAVTLCNASCELIITFPDGGSIIASEAVLFTFGSDGQLNLGAAGTINTNPQPASTDYTLGGTLALAKGEGISFDSGGVIRLGVGGNVEYSDMVIDSTGGSARVKAVGNTESIFIDNLTILGTMSITMEGRQLSLTGALNVAPDSEVALIAGTSGLTPSVCTIQNASSGVSLSAGTIDTTSSCNAISAGLSLPAGTTISASAIDPNATLVSSGSIILTPTPVVVSTADITLQPQNLTQALLATFADGTSLATDDGNACAITAGECVSAAGETYVVVDGKLVLPAGNENPVPAVGGSGAASSGLAGLLLMPVLIMTFRFKAVSGRKSRHDRVISDPVRGFFSA